MQAVARLRHIRHRGVRVAGCDRGGRRGGRAAFAGMAGLSENRGIYFRQIY